MKIAIASGKGGTGKTFLSTNLFRTMEQAGLSVTLVDCDAEVPNASIFIEREKIEVRPTRSFCPTIDTQQCTFCGKCTEYCNYHTITCIPNLKYIKVLPDLCHGCEACLYACTNGAITPAWKEIGKVTAYGNNNQPQLIEAKINEGEHSPVGVIRDAIGYGEQSGSHYLILDAPPGCSCPFVNTVMDADFVILITEPTPFGLSDLKHTIEVLRRLNKSFSVVINRADIGGSEMKDFLNENHIEILAEIPYSEEVASLYSEGKFLVDSKPEMKRLFNHLVKQIQQHEDSSH